MDYELLIGHLHLLRSIEENFIEPATSSVIAQPVKLVSFAEKTVVDSCPVHTHPLKLSLRVTGQLLFADVTRTYLL